MDTKTCSHCKIEKPLVDFYVDKSVARARHACKVCEGLHCKRYREKNRDKVALQKKKYKEENPHKAKDDYRKRQHREILLKKKYKEANPCKDCGKYYPYYVMDFDHLNPETKIGNPFAVPDKLLESEIAKCELVCANCHRTRTHNRLINTGKK